MALGTQDIMANKLVTIEICFLQNLQDILEILSQANVTLELSYLIFIYDSKLKPYE